MWAKIVSFFMSIYVMICGFFGIQTNKTDVPTSNEKTAVVHLVGNPSTGYSWNYNIDDESIAKCTDETSVYQGKNGISGAAGDFYYSFEGVKAGTTVVTFTYQRSWEDKIPEKIINYQLAVDSDLNITCVEIS